MSKLPAFQFYPADWRKDPGVQCLSFEDRGIWLEILCLMHESPRRGVLLMPNGGPMMSISLARIIGAPLPKVVKAMDRIALAGVSSREEGTGALFNRRMVRDEALRQVRKECGKMGGNPDLVKVKVNQNANHPANQAPNQTPTPSTSPSSSSSTSASQGKREPSSPSVDEAFETFAEEFNERKTPAKYPRHKKHDFVQLAALRKTQGLKGKESPPDWRKACRNYLSSPMSNWTLADLCGRYAVFVASGVDKYGKPLQSKARDYDTQPVEPHTSHHCEWCVEAHEWPCEYQDCTIEIKAACPAYRVGLKQSPARGASP